MRLIDSDVIDKAMKRHQIGSATKGRGTRVWEKKRGSNDGCGILDAL